jgi:hypothetical protein
LNDSVDGTEATGTFPIWQQLRPFFLIDHKAANDRCRFRKRLTAGPEKRPKYGQIVDRTFRESI